MTRWRDKKNPFKVGDLVKVDSSAKFFKGKITQIGESELMSIMRDNGLILFAHWRQCKKLKPKEKKYKITKKQLADAWDSHLYPYSKLINENENPVFKSFCKELGIEE